jgi:CelD/BcsL family acetyltransferase involved in cellulose biosynthesis
MTLAPPATVERVVRLGLEEERWSSFVERRADSAFHHPAWTRLLSDCYGYDGFALAVERDGELRAGLPLLDLSGRLRPARWASLPFTDFCPPIAADKLTDALLQARIDHGIASIDVRAPLDGEGVGRRLDGLRHVLALSPDPSAVLATFGKSRVRQVIRKAETSGQLAIRVAQDVSDLADVYYRLHLDTRRRLGVPVQPRRFFRLLWERMLEPGLGFALLAYAGTTPVAGAVFLEWKGSVIYKFGAMRREFQQLRPSHLLLWTAIRAACERGNTTFDFGRTDLGAESLRQFKLGWGTVEEPLVYSTLGANVEGRVGSGRIGDTLALMIRRSPSWVCRATGELFYRYAA